MRYSWHSMTEDTAVSRDVYRCRPYGLRFTVVGMAYFLCISICTTVFKAAVDPFRPKFEGALSYFVGGDKVPSGGYAEDKQTRASLSGATALTLTNPNPNPCNPQP